jgi:hypothetical protein
MSNVRGSFRKKSAILSGDQLDQARPHFERWVSIALLVLSFGGTIVALHGGWDVIAAGHLQLAAILGGIALQALCTAVEWFYRHKRLHPFYLLALVLDAGPTAIGYHAILAPGLLALLAIAGLTGGLATAITYGLIIVSAVILAWLPEGSLIDE